MLRKIIVIDEEKCNGCGACAKACHEGAIEMINEKAKLVREEYCDGLGDCLPVCPTDAIRFEMREAPAYNQNAVEQAKKSCRHTTGGCPGSAPKSFARGRSPVGTATSRLMQWPCQIKLVPVNAPYFEDANLLIAADCTAYAYCNFHEEFIRNHITLIGCPKLDDGDYAEKLTEILTQNRIKSVKVVRMEVPCCGGLEYAAQQAWRNSGQPIPWQVITVSTDGNIIEQ